MIRGIGIDIVSIERIGRAIERYGDRFTVKIFTRGEREYCMSRKRFAESFAGRFAVKEAAFKALGRGWDECGGFTSVEVTVAGNGRPDVVFRGNALSYFRDLMAERAFISITHDHGVAAAVVVLDG